jgi:hypothetical protein
MLLSVVLNTLMTWSLALTQPAWGQGTLISFILKAHEFIQKNRNNKVR